MSRATRTGLWVLAVALVMGVLGDALFQAGPPGINLLLWTGALLAGVAVLARQGLLTPAGEGRWLAVPLLLFAAGAAWRASPTLLALDVLALLVTGALAVHYARTGHLRTAGLADYALALLLAAGQAIAGLLPLIFSDIQWPEIPRGRWTRQALAAVRGMLLAAPLLLVFGALFMAADAVFARMVSSLLRIDLDTWFRHGVRFACWAWVTGGLLRGAWQGPLLVWRPAPAEPSGTGERPPAAWKPKVSLGTVEIGVALGLLNALFLAFVAVQFRYFFGGAALVEATTGLTYAEYARRGFFELVGVAALVLPLLLLAHWLLPGEGAGGERLFRLLAGALVAMLAVIMASAAQRMRLYQQAFGLTELRLYTTAFMAWLAVLFAWFCATVLRGRRERFAFGGLVSGLVTLALLHALNPDALIVAANVRRLAAGRPFDAAYAASLSADAVPALIRALPALPEPERRAAAGMVLERWAPPQRVDWRTWNWGRTRARGAVEAHREELHRFAGRP